MFYFILVCDPTSQASPKHPTPEVVDTASWPLEVDFAQPLTWSPVSRASLLSQEAFTWQSPSPSGFPFPIVPSIGGVHHTMTPPPRLSRTPYTQDISRPFPAPFPKASGAQLPPHFVSIAKPFILVIVLSLIARCDCVAIACVFMWGLFPPRKGKLQVKGLCLPITELLLGS